MCLHPVRAAVREADAGECFAPGAAPEGCEVEDASALTWEYEKAAIEGPGKGLEGCEGETGELHDTERSLGLRVLDFLAVPE